MKILKNKFWDELSSPRVSLILLGFRRADWLASAIESFVDTARNQNWEVIFVLNGANEGVREYVTQSLRQKPWPMAVVEISGRRPGAARNCGVEHARGDILLFLDDDIQCFQDMVSPLMRIFQDPSVMVAGGANLSPPDSSPLQRANGYIMESPMGAAGMSSRYRVLSERRAGEHELILCNLAVRKSAFGDGFVRHLISNEENVLLQRLANKGMPMVHSPDLAVFHRRRESFQGIWEQAKKYGSGRMQNILLHPDSFQFVYLLPAVFTLFFPLCILGALLHPRLICLPLAYFLLAAIIQISAFARTRDPAVLWIWILLPWIHIAYGWGFLHTAWRQFLARSKLRQSFESS